MLFFYFQLNSLISGISSASGIIKVNDYGIAWASAFSILDENNIPRINLECGYPFSTCYFKIGYLRQTISDWTPVFTYDFNIADNKITLVPLLDKDLYPTGKVYLGYGLWIGKI